MRPAPKKSSLDVCYSRFSIFVFSCLFVCFFLAIKLVRSLQVLDCRNPFRQTISSTSFYWRDVRAHFPSRRINLFAYNYMMKINVGVRTRIAHVYRIASVYWSINTRNKLCSVVRITCKLDCHVYLFIIQIVSILYGSETVRFESNGPKSCALAQIFIASSNKNKNDANLTRFKDLHAVRFASIHFHK